MSLPSITDHTIALQLCVFIMGHLGVSGMMHHDLKITPSLPLPPSLQVHPMPVHMMPTHETAPQSRGQMGKHSGKPYGGSSGQYWNQANHL